MNEMNANVTPVTAAWIVTRSAAALGCLDEDDGTGGTPWPHEPLSAAIERTICTLP